MARRERARADFTLMNDNLTPGPWRAAKYPDCKTWTVYSANGGTVASRLTEADAKWIAERGPSPSALSGPALLKAVSEQIDREFSQLDQGAAFFEASLGNRANAVAQIIHVDGRQPIDLSRVWSFAQTDSGHRLKIYLSDTSDDSEEVEVPFESPASSIIFARIRELTRPC
jgi:hypothetical protein